MSLPLEYLSDAQDDVDAAYRWYEKERAGLGERFLSALKDHLDQIQARPEMYAVIYKRVRGAAMKVFPYVVYYRMETDRILVVAVMHGHRKARIWRSRV